ncbi:restriction endonuclease [Intrasporangium calvum]|uniref:Restriction endonuclease n=1 Tax=Intrasporangium calvum TaxID=53358 RepID=A0ABT5GL32_9MICO|nr:restriction endonuclease [Intrasporangium calvum]MDC5698726.1 restriction endonuclease [Intrasporangium calvum]
MTRERQVQIGETVRYARTSSLEAYLEGYLNFHHLTRSPRDEDKRIILESGINRIAVVDAVDGRRRPAIVVRSSPWKAGSETTPWHDEFDLDHGHIRYFGDHKPTTVGPVGITHGNRALLEAWRLHESSDAGDRALAPPLLVFAARPVYIDGRRVDKGFLDFAGVCIIERLEFVVQRDPATGRSFPNLAVDLNVIRLDEDDEVDWTWIDDRRDPTMTAAVAMTRAPDCWKTWVRRGRIALPGIRRRVLSSRVLGKADQLPAPGSPEVEVLNRVYAYFDSHKHAFELLAAKVAADVLGARGGAYSDGWLTRSGGDGGMDFVGRLDIGPGSGSTPLVVLGQAKCISPNSSVSPDQVARLVARLRRGWVGIFVTTGTFSRQAQIEIVDDQYPVVLVSGRRLAEVVRRIAHESYEGEVAGLLNEVVSAYEGHVTHRRPEEVITSA